MLRLTGLLAAGVFGLLLVSTVPGSAAEEDECFAGDSNYRFQIESEELQDGSLELRVETCAPAGFELGRVFLNDWISLRSRHNRLYDGELSRPVPVRPEYGEELIERAELHSSPQEQQLRFYLTESADRFGVTLTTEEKGTVAVLTIPPAEKRVRETVTGSPLDGVEIDPPNFVRVPAGEVFSRLGELSGVDFTVAEALRGREVTLRFADYGGSLSRAITELTEALSSGGRRIASFEDGESVFIGTENQYRSWRDSLRTETFPIRYADPVRLAQIVRDFYAGSTGGQDVRVKAYPGEQAESANSWSVYRGETVASGSREPTDVNTAPENILVVEADAETLARIDGLIDRLDRRAGMIELEVRVYEVEESALQELGLRTDTTISDRFIEEPSNVPFPDSWTREGRLIDDELPAGIFRAFGVRRLRREGLAFQSFLDVMIEEGRAERLAQPVLTTVDGKTASYFAGQKLPLDQFGSNVHIEEGARYRQKRSFIDVGVKMEFQPRLEQQEELSVKVRAEVSSLQEIHSAPPRGPIVNSREVSTIARVQDGEPFVLAGMMTEEEIESIRKIPVLSEVPLLGELFESTDTDHLRTEVIVVVTPRIQS